MTLILGHRGARAYYAENTLLSFEQAIIQGADGIELDIHYSKDGQIMVFHDFTLDRMCGVKGAIYEFTAEALKKFKVQFKNQYEQIPTLDEVLQLIVALQQKFGRLLIVNVELKAGSDFYPDIEEKALALCYTYLPKEQVIFSSFDHYALKRIKEIDRTALTGILTASALVDPWEYVEKLEANFYHPNYQSLTGPTMKAFFERGIKLNPYTVNDVKIARSLIENGLNALITDTPDVMVALNNEIQTRGSYENSI
jgi:glycerophosphoryl diester phosphodiesterase